MSTENQPPAAQPDQESPHCAICGTIINPDPGWGKLPPPDPEMAGKQKSWVPNMSQAFHQEWAVIGPQLKVQAAWFGADTRSIVNGIRRFVDNPHQQDLFGDRLCNLLDGTHHLIGCLQTIAAMLERLDLEKRYELPTALTRPLVPPNWRSWTRTLLPL